MPLVQDVVIRGMEGVRVFPAIIEITLGLYVTLVQLNFVCASSAARLLSLDVVILFTSMRKHKPLKFVMARKLMPSLEFTSPAV
tara:strand:+ start:2287 stop:2538 length:252 start_codon:yes stop_codon:yes gene_type:complete